MRVQIIYLLLSFSITSFAQTTNLDFPSDTVYLIEKPHVIHRQVVLGEGAGGFNLKEVKKNEWNIYCKFLAGNQSVNYPDTGLKINMSNNLQSSAGLTMILHKLQISIGLGIFSSSAYFSTYKTNNLTRTETVKYKGLLSGEYHYTSRTN